MISYLRRLDDRLRRQFNRACDSWIVRQHQVVDIDGEPVCRLCRSLWPCPPVKSILIWWGQQAEQR